MLWESHSEWKERSILAPLVQEVSCQPPALAHPASLPHSAGPTNSLGSRLRTFSPNWALIPSAFSIILVPVGSHWLSVIILKLTTPCFVLQLLSKVLLYPTSTFLFFFLAIICVCNHSLPANSIPCWTREGVSPWRLWLSTLCFHSHVLTQLIHWTE